MRNSKIWFFYILIYLSFPTFIFSQIVNLNCQLESDYIEIGLDRKDWNGGSSITHNEGALHNITLPSNTFGDCKRISNISITVDVNNYDFSNLPPQCNPPGGIFLNIAIGCEDTTPASCSTDKLIDEIFNNSFVSESLTYSAPPENFVFGSNLSIDIVPLLDISCPVWQTALSSGAIILGYELCVEVTIEDENFIENVELGPDLSICSASFVEVDAGSMFDSYTWEPNGESTQTINADQGLYSVTVSDANGCTSSDEIIISSSNDSLALVAFYNALNGPNWINMTTPWDLSTPYNSWEGVTTNLDGCVTSINLNMKGLAGEIPDEIGELSSLQHIVVVNNNINGILTNQIGQLSELLTLNLSSNNISGELPESISNLSKLEELRLDFNSFTGSLPENIGDLDSLHTLQISLGNQLSGSLPGSIGDLESIVNLDLAKNNFSGNLPDVFSNLSTLRNLNLNENAFTGSIPLSLTQLPDLNNLRLFSNQFTGEIPPEFGDINFNNLYLNDNDLSGCIDNNLLNLCGTDATGFLSKLRLHNNPKLPWEGNVGNFCDEEEQIGAECNAFGINGIIDSNCNCSSTDGGIVALGVWEDSDGDGLQGNGEVLSASIPVEDIILWQDVNESNDIDASDVSYNPTIFNGFYRFDNLPVGGYILQYAPSGSDFYPTQLGMIETNRDNDIDPLTRISQKFEISENEIKGTIDIGLIRPSTISGAIFCDKNGNGFNDDGDFLNIEFSLKDITGNLAINIDGNIISPIFSAAGLYSFENLRPGSYHVVSNSLSSSQYFTIKGSNGVGENDFDPSTNRTDDIILESGIDLDGIDAGVVSTFVIEGTLWIEDDGNSMYEGESGLAGVPVRLMDNNTGVTATDVNGDLVGYTTDVSGNYRFEGVKPGEYFVFAGPNGLNDVESCDGQISLEIEIDNDDNGEGSSSVTSQPFILESDCTENQIIDHIDFCFRNKVDFYTSCEIASENILCSVAEITSFVGEMPITDSGGNQPEPLCPQTGSGVAHNISWVAFTTPFGSYEMQITPYMCEGSTSGQEGVQIGVYTNCEFDESVYCNENCSLSPAIISSDILTAGEIYYLFIDGCSGSVCNYEITFDGNPEDANSVENDSPCETSENPPIDLTGSGAYTGNNNCANQDFEFSNCPEQDFHQVWFTYTTQTDDNNIDVRLEMLSGNFVLGIYEYSVDCIGTPVEVLHSVCDNENVDISVAVEENATYLVKVSSPIGSSGEFSLIIESSKLEGIPCIGSLDECRDESLMFNVTSRSNGGNLNGPFCPGEKLTIFLGFNYNSSLLPGRSLSGFVPIFGDGYDMNSINFSTIPPPITGNGIESAEWFEQDQNCTPLLMRNQDHLTSYIDENGKLLICNKSCEECQFETSMKKGDPLPSGFFWINSGIGNTCDPGSCNPNGNFGTIADFTPVYWEFDIFVKDEEDCLDNVDLQIKIQTFSDAVTGCREFSEASCEYDRMQFSPQWEIECQTPTFVNGNSKEICSGDFVDLDLITADGSDVEIRVEVDDNPNVSGAMDYTYEGGFGTINDELTNLTSTIQSIFYNVYSIDPDRPCHGEVNRIEVIVFPELLEPEIGGDFVVCFEDDATLTIINASDYSSIVWSEGNVDGPSITVSPLLTTNYSLTVTDNNGCSLQTEVTVDIRDLPSSEFSAFNDPLCIESIVEVSYLGSSDIDNYEWNFDGATITNATGGVGPGPHLLSFAMSGNFDINLDVTDEDGCLSSSQNVYEIEDALFPLTINCTPSLDQVEFSWTYTDEIVGVESIEVLTGQSGTLTGSIYTVIGLAAAEMVEIEVIFETTRACPTNSAIADCITMDCPELEISSLSDQCRCKGNVLDFDELLISSGPGSWSLFDFNNDQILIDDQNNFSVDDLDIGTYELIFSSEESEFCTERISFNVIQVEPIFIDPPVDVTVSCEEVQNLKIDLAYSSNLTGNCEESGFVSAMIVGDYGICGGVVNYNWEYTTDCGSVITHISQVMVLEDESSVSFSETPEDITVNCDNIPEIKEIVITNEIFGECAFEDVVQPTLNENYNDCGGTIEVTWNYSMECINKAQTQIITIVPIAPSFSSIEGFTLDCGEDFPESISLEYSNGLENCSVAGSIESIDDGGEIDRIYNWTYQDQCTGEDLTESIVVSIIEELEDEDFGIIELCSDEIAAYEGPNGWQDENTSWNEGFYSVDIVDDDGCIFTQSVQIELLEIGENCDFGNNVIGILNSICDCVSVQDCESSELYIDSTLCVDDIWLIEGFELSADNSRIEEVYIDQRGCDSVVIYIGDFVPHLCTDDCLDENNYLYPSGFTPNGDGVNDFFVIIGLSECAQELQRRELTVFNRWGEEIYYSEDYKNDWNGEDKRGNKLPEGTYYYTAILDGVQSLVHSGYVVILR